MLLVWTADLELQGIRRKSRVKGQAKYEATRSYQGLSFQLGLAAQPSPPTRCRPQGPRCSPKQVSRVPCRRLPERVPRRRGLVREFAGGDGPGRPGGQLNMLVASARA